MAKLKCGKHGRRAVVVETGSLEKYIKTGKLFTVIHREDGSRCDQHTVTFKGVPMNAGTVGRLGKFSGGKTVMDHVGRGPVCQLAEDFADRKDLL